MMSDERLAQINDTLSKASPSPWVWAYTWTVVPTDDPELLADGISTLPGPEEHIQLVANGKHRFWLELTDTRIDRDLIPDLDFIKEAREFVPELLAEIERLRGLLGRKSSVVAFCGDTKKAEDEP